MVTCKQALKMNELMKAGREKKKADTNEGLRKHLRNVKTEALCLFTEARLNENSRREVLGFRSCRTDARY